MFAGLFSITIVTDVIGSGVADGSFTEDIERNAAIGTGGSIDTTEAAGAIGFDVEREACFLEVVFVGIVLLLVEAPECTENLVLQIIAQISAHIGNQAHRLTVVDTRLFTQLDQAPVEAHRTAAGLLHFGRDKGMVRRHIADPRPIPQRVAAVERLVARVIGRIHVRISGRERKCRSIGEIERGSQRQIEYFTFRQIGPSRTEVPAIEIGVEIRPGRPVRWAQRQVVEPLSVDEPGITFEYAAGGGTAEAGQQAMAFCIDPETAGVVDLVGPAIAAGRRDRIVEFERRNG